MLEHLQPGSDLILPLANGEPVVLLDAIEAHAGELDDVKVHQMHAVHDRPYLHGAFGNNLRHVSYFLSHVTRQPFRDGTIDLVPNNFSEMRNILQGAHPRSPGARRRLAPGPPRVLQPRSQRRLRGVVHRPSTLLPREQRTMPRTFGRNQIHESQVLGWVEADYPLVEVAPPPRSELDDRIASYVAERIPNRATIQTGIGSIPNAILAALRDHRELGVHTELISDGLMDLVERGVVNGVAKQLNRTKTVGTFALGTQELYEFLDENTAFELWPVRYVNDPRVIAQEEGFVSINSTISVDLMGQCASETVHGEYYSSSGGQADFARGAMYSKGGQGFVVLRSTAKGGTVSKIVAELEPGDVVTTLKNTVDKVVTEWGVAELRGRSLRERAAALIGIAHPDHRDQLRFDARRLGRL